MGSVGSMAVWCAHRLGESGASADVHFNYWRVAQKPGFFRKRKPENDFAEIGVLIADPKKIERIRIFVPYRISAKEIKDCGPYFRSVEIAQGIFNEPLTSHLSGPPGPSRVDLMKNGISFCRVHQFALSGEHLDEGQLTLSDEDGGTLVTITRHALDEVGYGMTNIYPAYFRIRTLLPSGDPNPFISVTSPHDRWFQSGFEEIECVDFRLNEARTLPPKIETLMRTDAALQPAELKKVAFLTAIPVTAELTGTSIATHKNRVLEHNIWNSYVADGLPAGMMVYHWRSEKTPVEDFFAFVKLRIRRSSLRILLTYLLIAFAFGVLGNLTASRIDAGIASSSNGPQDAKTSAPSGEKRR
ncbi:hypothetical protein JQ609_03465 [Bradyrhizobium sp. AUGA SZCCT0169]|uniref:hypothetical protein n=1 Tax=Bradyrhizobium sp. AUGA SZCCT0169 TaxID=2807663 RepID=UPI001BA9D493|nr:hypothetical protein [Bradyrhizobium sp. AUGA SZCCT0169]MBR1245986.1 hypothetical protein [Bradyrhizobium sp. AUGA SZCCT0169]